MKDYTINEDTLAVMPLGKKKSIIYENHNCYIIEERVSKVMEKNCQAYGSSIEGRTKGTYSLTGFTYKAPIVISEDKDIVFFPTCSPRLKDCSWISADHINKIYSKNEKSLVEFVNDECLEVDASPRIIQNQYLKSLSLKKAMKNRKN